MFLANMMVVLVSILIQMLHKYNKNLLFLDEHGPQNNTEVKMPMFVANISGQYDGSPGKQ